ncbi:T9SS type A sorting domain-containing protein [Carboxylicivirga sp. RSCT41]|uniref:T9SS type A sorting domain-containing protein n=1 Tax=Carboxylicivirga agarovorans TaxID=3417570 RepID=UPI003D33B7C6
MIKRLLLLFLSLCLVNILHSQVPDLEREALIALYNSTDGDNWESNTNWNTSTPVSEWFGITVVNNHVTKIDLPSNFLKGTLPSEIGNLIMLESLNLWINNLTGSIPEEIGNLINLTELFLDTNEFTGQIPASLSNLTLMTNFWLDDNQLSGDITDFFSSWTNLVYFGIGGGNNFTGSLDLSNNQSLIACWIDNSKISTLNIKNGNNFNIPNDHFKANNNPNLTCVIVDDVQYSTTNWLNIDESSLFLESLSECSSTSIDNRNYQAKKIYPNPTKGMIYIRTSEVIREIRIYNSLGQLVQQTKDLNCVDLSTLPRGLYYLYAEYGNSNINETYKIIKE